MAHPILLDLTAEARDWNRMVVLSTVVETMETVKAVVLSTTVTSENRMLIIRPCGTTIGIGVLGVEQTVLGALTPFQEGAANHQVVDLVLEWLMQNDEKFPNSEGVIVAIRTGGPTMSASDLEARCSSLS